MGGKSMFSFFQCWDIQQETPLSITFHPICQIINIKLKCFFLSFFIVLPFSNLNMAFCVASSKFFHFIPAVKHGFHFVSLDYLTVSYIKAQLILPKVELHVCGVYLVLFFNQNIVVVIVVLSLCNAVGIVFARLWIWYCCFMLKLQRVNSPALFSYLFLKQKRHFSIKLLKI